MSEAQQYQDKAKRSFNTKLNMYVFTNYLNKKLDDIKIENLKDFKDFIITREIVDKYTTCYCNDYELNGISTNDIYKSIKKWENENPEVIEYMEGDYVKNFEQIFSFEDFKKLLKEEQCHYCKITVDELEILYNKKQIQTKRLRGDKLEIDCRKPNFEYTKDNCVRACYWCNNAKTDEFSEDEFMEIASGIGKIWKKRLEK